MGTVEMKQPAMGMKEQMKTNRDSSPLPGIARHHMPMAVRAVLAMAIRACDRKRGSASVDEFAADGDMIWGSGKLPSALLDGKLQRLVHAER